MRGHTQVVGLNLASSLPIVVIEVLFLRNINIKILIHDGERGHTCAIRGGDD